MTVLVKRHHRAAMLDRTLGAGEPDRAPMNRNEVVVLCKGIHQDLPVAGTIIAVAVNQGQAV